MTNPAVEALKPFLRHSPSCELQYSGARSEDCNCGLNRAIAQAEQTPVGVWQDGTNFRGWVRPFDNGRRVEFATQANPEAGWEPVYAKNMEPPPSVASASGREAGRWVSEELWEELVEDVQELRNMISPLIQEGHHARLGARLDALRAAPSFPKEE